MPAFYEPSTLEVIEDIDGEQILYIVRGLPGAGKSTLSSTKIAPDTTVSADDYFMHGGKYVFDRNKLGEAHAYCQRRVEELLEDDHNVAVANTFTQRWEIEPYLKIADKAGAIVCIIDLYDGGLSDEQLAARNVHGVPLDVIAGMRKRYEHDWINADPRAPWEKNRTPNPQLGRHGTGFVSGYEIKPGADLRGADLSGEDLEGANLCGADLSPATRRASEFVRFSPIQYIAANLSKANLKGADLSFANLSNSNLQGADLFAADLTGANLIRVNLVGANLTRANLTGANLYNAQVSPEHVDIIKKACSDMQASLMVRSSNPRYHRGR